MYGRAILEEIRAGDFSGITLVEDTFTDMGDLLGLGKNEIRGLGHTTHQMVHAPKDAIFVWCNNEIAYPMHLARRLDRADLTIRAASWLHEGNLRYQGRKVIVIDHAFEQLNPGPERTHIHELSRH